MDDGRGKRVAGRWRMHIFFIDFLLRNHGDCRFLIPTGRESNCPCDSLAYLLGLLGILIVV